MSYFKDENNEIYGYDKHQLPFVPSNLIEITEEEKDEIIANKYK